MLARILRAPMAFFDTVPIGRIVNRFSRDLEAVDKRLPNLISDCVEAGFKSFYAVLVVCVATPYSLIIILPMLVFCYFLQVRDFHLLLQIFMNETFLLLMHLIKVVIICIRP